jgi:hypothetical protein
MVSEKVVKGFYPEIIVAPKSQIQRGVKPPMISEKVVYGRFYSEIIAESKSPKYKGAYPND